MPVADYRTYTRLLGTSSVQESYATRDAPLIVQDDERNHAIYENFPATGSRQIATSADIGPLFGVLADWWHEATDALSSPERKANHRAYRRIIAMGEKALPFIIADLQSRGGQWFEALEQITGEQPQIPDGYRNNIEGERAAWLRWAIDRHILR